MKYLGCALAALLALWVVLLVTGTLLGWDRWEVGEVSVLWARWSDSPWHALVSDASRITACADMAPIIHRTSNGDDVTERNVCRVCYRLAWMKANVAHLFEGPGRRHPTPA